MFLPPRANMSFEDALRYAQFRACQTGYRQAVQKGDSGYWVGRSGVQNNNTLDENIESWKVKPPVHHQ